MLLRACPGCSCILGPAKQRLGLRKPGLDFGSRVHPFPTIPTWSSTHDVLVKRFIDTRKEVSGNEKLMASSEAEEWKDVLQHLKEQNE